MWMSLLSQTLQKYFSTFSSIQLLQEAEEERQRIEAEKKREEDEKRRAALEETSRKQREREREIEEKMSRNNQSDDRMGGDNKGEKHTLKTKNVGQF